MTRSGILSMFLILSLLALPAAAQSPRCGSVNLAVLYNFHPLVQTWVPDRHAFMKPGSPDELQSRYLEQRENVHKFQLKVADIENKIARLEDEKRLLQTNAWQRRRRIETDMEDMMKNPANKEQKFDFTREKNLIRDLEEEMFKAQKKIDGEIARLNDEARKEEEKLKSIQYYTGDEHIKLITRINDEIRDAVRSEAAKQTMGFVLNTGRFRLTVPARKQGKFDFSRIYDPSRETMPPSIYTGEFSIGKMIDMHGGVEDSKGFLDYQLEHLATLCERIPRFAAPFASVGVNDLVLEGGGDITAAVLRTLLEKHRIDKKTVDLLVRGVEAGMIH